MPKGIYKHPKQCGFQKGCSTFLGKKHSQKTKKLLSISKLGEKNPQYKGRMDAQGYIYIYSSTHPYRDRNKHIFEHRLVVEKCIGRYLKPSEKVHHINGIKSDNRIENLMIVANPHLGEVKCPYCSEKFLIR